MALIDTYTLARGDGTDETNFRNKIVAQLIKTANYILLTETDATREGKLRRAWATNTLENPETMRDRMVWFVVIDSGITSAIVADNAIEAAVSVLIDRFAGI